MRTRSRSKRKKEEEEEEEEAAEEASDSVLKGTSPERQDAGASIFRAPPTIEKDGSELDWEDGAISTSYSRDDELPRYRGTGVTIEFNGSPSSSQRKTVRRATAEEKKLAELVHKVHLLCLLARGRLVDRDSSDPLIQASLLSLVPSKLLKIAEAPKLTINLLTPLVNWFQNNFHVQSSNIKEGSFKANLAFALGIHEGTAEEVAALSVALFRALNLTARFVSILDVVSLKPDAEMSGCLDQDTPGLDTRIPSSTMMVASSSQGSAPYPVHSSPEKPNLNEIMGTSTGKACHDNLDACAIESSEKLKRKGDLEFELQLEMAFSATALAVRDGHLGSNVNDIGSSSDNTSPFKKFKKAKSGESSVSTQGGTGAVWSRKLGPPLYWAEVYCSGETFTGRWVYVDAANAVIDGEEKVEAAAAACKRPLKYIVAFSGHGAKDVTRRYCRHWYKIASQRINSNWWDAVLVPLRELESAATGGTVQSEVYQVDALAEPQKKMLEISGSQGTCSSEPVEPSSREDADYANLSGELRWKVSKWHGSRVHSDSPTQHHGVATRSSLEDMELETRALTEPLPTNQQAYRNHHLYVIERWLTKYQILHPKGPILGYCSGHPVYPRACVQTLQTKQKWLREGLQVKANEVPAKSLQVLKNKQSFGQGQTSEPSTSEEDDGNGKIELYGKWQMESLCLPHAVDGIVPKNEHGQVDVWSEKCLPPGTVHLRLPRLVQVAKRLGIDFAPAMVGFEFHNGHSVPIFEGIVVCTEFKGAILEAYAEEEERREAEEKKRNEAQALSRWHQLLSSIITRQRLKNTYEDASSSRSPHKPINDQKNDPVLAPNTSHDDQLGRPQQASIHSTRPGSQPEINHEHVFPMEDQSFDEESSIRIKRCPCGFSIQVEEL